MMLSNLHWNRDKPYNTPICRRLFLIAASYNCLVIPFGAAFAMNYTLVWEETGKYTMLGLNAASMVMSLVWVYPIVLLRMK